VRDVTILGPSRRVGALIALKLASALLRGGTALYQRGAMPRLLLRAVLSVSQALERAGVRVAFGRKSKWRSSHETKRHEQEHRMTPHP
jgi:hypothetical protein